MYWMLRGLPNYALREVVLDELLAPAVRKMSKTKFEAPEKRHTLQHLLNDVGKGGIQRALVRRELFRGAARGRGEQPLRTSPPAYQICA